MNITEFLEARIAEDEDLADRSIRFGDKGAQLLSFGSKDSLPVLILHPARVLAECAAKRAIIELAQKASEDEKEYDDYEWQGTVKRSEPLTGDAILFALAAVYKDHPAYQTEWSL